MEWISVKDEFPDLEEEVLVYQPENDDMVCIGYLMQNPRTEKIYWNKQNGIEEIHGVTHWLQIPEPPKEE